MASFSSDIAKYAKKTGLSIDNAVVAICAEASTSIIKMTPRKSGRAAGNWFATIDEVSSESSETRREGEAIADAMAKSKKAAGHIFNLTNNLSYIRPLEYGHSKQAKNPDGMVRITVEKISTSLKIL